MHTYVRSHFILHTYIPMSIHMKCICMYAQIGMTSPLRILVDRKFEKKIRCEVVEHRRTMLYYSKEGLRRRRRRRLGEVSSQRMS